MPTKQIAVLTGGGDVPGLNAAIKSVYLASRDRGWLRGTTGDANVLGILRGWKGAVALSTAPESGEGAVTVALTDDMVRTVDRYGGTFLHASRTRPDRVSLDELPAALGDRVKEMPRARGKEDLVDATEEVIRGLRRHGVDALVAIGGDDTLGYAHTLSARGFPVVGIPKTMDNDIRGTEYAIGYKTALTRADAFINRQRTHLASHETVGVFRIFGRNAGFTALGTCMAISDALCLIPECPFDLDALCRMVERDCKRNPQHYALVVCSEGAMWKGGTIEEYGPPDAYGHRKKVNVGEAIAAAITRMTGLPTRVQDVTYDLRSGSPDAIDKIVANTFGTLAVDLIAEGRTGRMVCVRNGIYTDADLPDPKQGARTIDVDSHYDKERFRPHFRGLKGKPVFF